MTRVPLFRRWATEPVLPFALFVAAAGAVLLATLAMAGELHAPLGSSAYLAVAAGVLVTELVPVRLPRRDEDLTLTASTPFALALLVSWGVGPAILAQALGTVLNDARRRSPPIKLAFNLAQACLVVAAAGGVYAIVGTGLLANGHPSARDLAALLPVALVLLVLNGLFAPFAAALAQRRAPAPFIAEHFRRWTVVEALPLALTPLVLTAAHAQPAFVSLMLLPLLAVALLGREALGRDASEERFRALLEGAPEAILVLDGGRQVTLANAQAERVFGRSSMSLVGVSVERLFAPESGVGLAAALDDAPRASEQAPSGYDNGRLATGLRANGAEFPVGVVMSRTGSDLAPAAILSVRDLSEQERARHEREELEQRVSQSERLETVGTLSGGVAHDFNNLLAVILNCASFIEQEAEGQMLEDVREIRLAAERGAALTRQLLIFSRRDTQTPEALDPAAVVSETAGLLRRALGEHIELDLQVGECPPVSMSHGHLEQALLNLAVNARDAMPQGGKLNVECATAGAQARVSIWDDGPGMPEDVAARVFEPFFSTKPVGEGTGLGLATVHGIVARVGGRVELHTSTGQGARFDLYFPATSAAPTSAVPDPTGEGAVGRGERVLLVEDESAVRAVTRRLLEEAGYAVLSTGDALGALGVLESENQIDLLLTDVVMPGLSGPDLAARVTELCPDLPVLFMSGYSEELMAPHGMPEEASLLRKPFDGDQLRRATREAFDRTRSKAAI